MPRREKKPILENLPAEEALKLKRRYHKKKLDRKPEIQLIKRVRRTIDKNLRKEKKLEQEKKEQLRRKEEKELQRKQAEVDAKIANTLRMIDEYKKSLSNAYCS